MSITKSGIQDYQSGVKAQAQAERDGLKGKVDAVRAQLGDTAATLYELKERERISAEEAFRLNFASSGQSLLEFTKDPERNSTAALKNTAMGIAKTIDAIIMDDRNPAEIYRDVKAKLGIEIAGWNAMTAAEQADAIGRLRGNLSAEVTKVVATGGTAAVGRRLLATGAVETAEGAAVRGLFDKANDGKLPDVDAPPPPNYNPVDIKVADVRRGALDWDLLNNPPPNTIIRLDNGNVYRTNAQGIVDEVSFQPRLVTGSRDGRQVAVGRQGLDTDVGGHIQACSLGGTCDRVNLFPQDRTFNNSDYKKFENEIRRALEAEANGGPKVGEVNVKFVRSMPSNPRPNQVEVTYTIGGKPTTVKFRNQSGG